MKKIIVLLCLLCLTGCSKSTGSTDTSKTTNEMQTPVTTEQSDNSIAYELTNVYNFVVDEAWNNHACNIKHYIEDGTDAVGNKLDITKTIASFSKIVDKKSEYNDFISSLDDTKYKDVKECWNKISSEIDSMYKQVSEKAPKPKDKSYKFKTDDLQKSMDDLYKLLY